MQRDRQRRLHQDIYQEQSEAFDLSLPKEEQEEKEEDCVQIIGEVNKSEPIFPSPIEVIEKVIMKYDEEEEVKSEDHFTSHLPPRKRFH